MLGSRRNCRHTPKLNYVDVDGVAAVSAPKIVIAGDGTLVVAMRGSKATFDEPPCVLLQKQVI